MDRRTNQNAAPQSGCRRHRNQRMGCLPGTVNRAPFRIAPLQPFCRMRPIEWGQDLLRTQLAVLNEMAAGIRPYMGGIEVAVFAVVGTSGLAHGLPADRTFPVDFDAYGSMQIALLVPVRYGDSLLHAMPSFPLLPSGVEHHPYLTSISSSMPRKTARHACKIGDFQANSYLFCHDAQRFGQCGGRIRGRKRPLRTQNSQGLFVELMTGFEPVTSSLPRMRSTD